MATKVSESNNASQPTIMVLRIVFFVNLIPTSRVMWWLKRYKALVYDKKTSVNYTGCNMISDLVSKATMKPSFFCGFLFVSNNFD